MAAGFDEIATSDFTPNTVGKQPGQWPNMGKHSKFYWEKTAEEIASDDELMSIAEEKINVTEQYSNPPKKNWFLTSGINGKFSLGNLFCITCNYFFNIMYKICFCSFKMLETFPLPTSVSCRAVLLYYRLQQVLKYAKIELDLTGLPKRIQA